MVITMKKNKNKKVLRKILRHPLTFLCALVACYWECVKIAIFGDKTSTHKELVLTNSIAFAVSAIVLAFSPWCFTSLEYAVGSIFMRTAEAFGGGVASADSITYALGKWLKALASNNHIGRFYTFCATESNYWIGVRFVLLVLFSIMTVAMITIATISVINIYKECREIIVDKDQQKALYFFIKSYSKKSKIDKVLNHELDLDYFDSTYLYDLKRDYRYDRFRNDPEVKQLVYDMELIVFLQDYRTKETSVFDMKADKRFKKFENEERVQNLYINKMHRAARAQ
jgi:hypothetical protein